MLQFEADPAVLRPHVPAGTELDAWRGRTLVSLVGFRFLKTRVLGVPVPFHQDFPEANLRFYVRRGDRRGVVFIREIVPKRAVAWVANAAYGESYRALPMRYSAESYEWKRDGDWCGIRGSAAGEWAVPEPGSQEEFIAEHYWGYAPGTEYRVDHPKWRVRPVEGASVTGDMAGTYPPGFSEALKRPPVSAFAAEGSEVSVCRGSRLALRSVQ